MSEVFPKNMNMKQAVLSTLAYFQLFEVPLTRSELSEHLFFAQPDEEKISIYLKESPLIKLTEGYYSLSSDPAFHEKFFEKVQRSRKLWKKVRRYQWLFSICPFVKLVCVCNSLPIYAVDEGSDIDLLVVTEKNRLFLARLCLTVLTSLFGVRRHGNKTEGRFCLSFYLSEDSTDFKKLAQEPYDIYLAYWLKTLEPIAGDYTVYEKILEENRAWLEEYFRTVTPHRRFFRKATPFQDKMKSWAEKILNKDEWEVKTREKQIRRAKDKFYDLKDRSGTVISPTMLKFHDKDRRSEIRKEWVALLNELL
ncbi:MAG: hypothetical protein AAB383_06430 [Patescibacteria group bacterium]